MKRIINLVIIIGVILAIRFTQTLTVKPPETPPEAFQFTFEEVRNIFPEATNLISSEKDDWNAVLDKSGQKIGLVITTRSYADNITGHAGATPLLIGADTEGNIVSVFLLDNREDPHFVGLVKSAGLLNRWNGMNWQDANHLEIDAVTGATKTSSAIIRSFKSSRNRNALRKIFGLYCYLDVFDLC